MKRRARRSEGAKHHPRWARSGFRARGSEWFQCRVTAEEQARIAAVARARGVDASALFRTWLASEEQLLDVGRAAPAPREALRARFEGLTPREREVCLRVTQGLINKQIAAELGTVEKTIKVHRSRVMMKLGVESLPELVRFVDRLHGV